MSPACSSGSRSHNFASCCFRAARSCARVCSTSFSPPYSRASCSRSAATAAARFLARQVRFCTLCFSLMASSFLLAWLECFKSFCLSPRPDLCVAVTSAGFQLGSQAFAPEVLRALGRFAGLTADIGTLPCERDFNRPRLQPCVCLPRCFARRFCFGFGLGFRLGPGRFLLPRGLPRARRFLQTLHGWFHLHGLYLSSCASCSARRSPCSKSSLRRLLRVVLSALSQLVKVILSTFSF